MTIHQKINAKGNAMQKAPFLRPRKGLVGIIKENYSRVVMAGYETHRLYDDLYKDRNFQREPKGAGADPIY